MPDVESKCCVQKLLNRLDNYLSRSSFPCVAHPVYTDELCDGILTELWHVSLFGVEMMLQTSYKQPSRQMLTLCFCWLQVPPELRDDLLLIADKIEPYLLQVKEQADKIPEKAHELAGKIQPAAEQLGDKIEEGASQV